MKKFKHLFAITILMLSLNLNVKAQSEITSESREYRTGLGLRLGGYTSGFTVKGFMNSNSALEGILGFGRRSFIVTGLYERHFPLAPAGLSLYAGGGAHLGLFGSRGSYLIYKNKSEKIYIVEEGSSAVIPGIDGIFGIEYKFQGAPFTVGADLKPFIDFFDGASGYVDGAFNVRYVF
jgi:hypothetical protein